MFKATRPRTAAASAGSRRREAPPEIVGPSAAAPGHETTDRAAAPPGEALPQRLREGAERMSGVDLSTVRVHYDSPAPKRLHARAYALSDEIHLAPGQRRHLPHEVWHAVQKRQGRVRADSTVNGAPANADAALEAEADAMGARLDSPAAGAAGAFPASAPATAGDAAQLVGEKKFIIGRMPAREERKGDEKEAPQKGSSKVAIDPNHHAAVLNKAYLEYVAAKKEAKEVAATKFQRNAGDEYAQKAYEDDLLRNQVSPENFLLHQTFLPGRRKNTSELRSVSSEYSLKDGVFHYKNVPVAKALSGDDLYVQKEAASDTQKAVYQKRTFDGVNAEKEYVKVGDSYLRRFAYRGITPPERDAKASSKDLTPLNAERRTEGRTGYAFNKQSGRPYERAEEEGKPTKNDLDWLRETTGLGTNLKSIPDDKRVLSFLQSRKGTGKLLSARSTPRPITSNHGAEFTDWGEATIDLAKVPDEHITEHYKSGGLNDQYIVNKVNEGQPQSMTKQKENDLRYQVARANSTTRRNREIMFTSIPHRAVTIADRPASGSHADHEETPRTSTRTQLAPPHIPSYPATGMGYPPPSGSYAPPMTSYPPSRMGYASQAASYSPSMMGYGPQLWSSARPPMGYPPPMGGYGGYPFSSGGFGGYPSASGGTGSTGYSVQGHDPQHPPTPVPPSKPVAKRSPLQIIDPKTGKSIFDEDEEGDEKGY